MARRIIEDIQYHGRLNLLEAIGDKKDLPDGVLGRFEGPFAEYSKPTKNGRVYSEKLWENVLQSDYLAETYDSKTLFGELDHPSEYVEMRALTSAFNITKLEKRPDKGLIWGKADILNTPAGNVLYTLLKYGSKMGVSSRGSGSITEKDGVSYVSEDDFNFVTFDAVSQPSVAIARQGLCEGVEVDDTALNFTEGLFAGIKVASSTELEIYETVLKNSNLLEDIDFRRALSKRKRALKEEDSALQKDLANLIQRNKFLEEQNATLIKVKNKLGGKFLTKEVEVTLKEDEIMSHRAKSKELEESLVLAKAIKKKTSNKVATYSLKNKKLQERLSKFEKERALLKEELLKLEQLKSLVTELEESLEIKISRNNSLEETVKSSYAKVKTLQEQVKQLKEDSKKF